MTERGNSYERASTRCIAGGGVGAAADGWRSCGQQRQACVLHPALLRDVPDLGAAQVEQAETVRGAATWRPDTVCRQRLP